MKCLGKSRTKTETRLSFLQNFFDLELPTKNIAYGKLNTHFLTDIERLYVEFKEFLYSILILHVFILLIPIQ